MTWLRTLASRLAAIARWRVNDREIDDEIASHLEEATDDYVTRGLSRDEARLAARRDFGGITQVKEVHREVRSLTWPDSVGQDVKYSLRRLIKDPGATLIAVATMALGIGANTAIFSVVNGVLLNPLPYPSPTRIVAIYEKNAGMDRAPISYPNFLDWQQRSRSFEQLALYRNETYTLTGVTNPERLRETGGAAGRAR